MVTIPSSEPPSFIAGNTVQWTRTIDNYPSNAWTLTYYFIGPAVFTVVATTATNGIDFSIVIPASTTATYTPGRYSVTARAIQGSESDPIAVEYAQLVISANPSTSSAVDPTSYARKTLVVVEATISALAARTISNGNVNGQTYTLADLDKLLKLRAILRSEVSAEDNMAALNAGLGSPNRVKIRFVPTV